MELSNLKGNWIFNQIYISSDKVTLSEGKESEKK